MIIPTLPMGDLESGVGVSQAVIMNKNDNNEHLWIIHDIPGPALIS